MPITTITTPPPAPQRSDPTTFSDRSDAWLAYTEDELVPGINTVATEINAMVAGIDADAATATAQAVIATDAATAADASADAAAVSEAATLGYKNTASAAAVAADASADAAALSQAAAHDSELAAAASAASIAGGPVTSVNGQTGIVTIEAGTDPTALLYYSLIWS